MRNYSFMQNLPENYSIFNIKNKRKQPVKTKAERKLMQIKKLYPRLSKAEIQFSFFNDFYIFYQPLYAIVAFNRLTIRYRII